MVVAYPSLTPVEFAQAGKELAILCLGQVDRSDWQETRWTGDELQIRQHRHQLPHTKTYIEDELECFLVDEYDQEELNRTDGQSSSDLSIDFSVVLSPTYQVPVLWFGFINQAPTTVDTLDRVYKLIVSPSSRPGLRNVGVLGGISLGHHPISDMPAFFIHPCKTQEALESVKPDKSITPLEYLMLWLGIIGSAVSLSVPLNVMAAIHDHTASPPA